MLKAVVEHQDLTVQVGHGLVGQGHAVAALEVRHLRQVLGEHERLIVPAPPTAIAPAEDGHASVASVVQPGHIFDAGSLAGAAKRYIADTDDRYRHAPARLEAAVIQAVAPPSNPTVGHACRPQGAAKQVGPQPMALAANQGAKILAANRGRVLLTVRPGTSVAPARTEPQEEGVIAWDARRCQPRSEVGGIECGCEECDPR